MNDRTQNYPPETTHADTLRILARHISDHELTFEQITRPIEGGPLEVLVSSRSFPAWRLSLPRAGAVVTDARRMRATVAAEVDGCGFVLVAVFPSAVAA